MALLDLTAGRPAAERRGIFRLLLIGHSESGPIRQTSLVSSGRGRGWHNPGMTLAAVRAVTFQQIINKLCDQPMAFLE